ncbi:YqcC family protein [Pantoea sp. 1.19]|uniref:YqcC family protein n=1 Tax=Pantoea sp. 1.19 TaxID=1925589 RepID=UPI000948F72C|nr:YqcC family protein [Pantoea sp. 1.19]
MSREILLQHLHAVEIALRDTANWQQQAPAPEAFDSSQPFCVDTMAPTEWLQWVLLPRMRAILDSGAPLPSDFALTPYFEMALPADFSGRLLILLRLGALDDWFAGPRDA